MGDPHSVCKSKQEYAEMEDEGDVGQVNHKDDRKSSRLIDSGSANNLKALRFGARSVA